MIINFISILVQISREANVHLSTETAENTYAIATFLMKSSNWILHIFGLETHTTLYIWVYTVLVLLLSIIIGTICKWVILGIVNTVDKRIKSDLYTLLVNGNVFDRLCKIIPPLVFLIFIEFTLYTRANLALWLTKLTWIYVIFTVVRALDAVINVIWTHVDNRENKRKLPLNGLVQLIKGILWIIAVISVLAILFNKSPGSLLAGLGAFAAVLMLVFKDSILGVVAGVQLSENDSLHLGDWIKVPGTDANGSVIEVSLTSVKVRNWDKTVTTVPPYNLVSQGFTNYRQMQQSNTRRICRSFMIDADSVLPLDDNMLERLKKLPFMNDYITKKQAQKAAGKVEDVNNSEGLVDGTIETNLGLFRAYLRMYLDSSEYISHTDTCFVSTLPQTNGGIPLQIYAFTSTSAWLPYEAMMDAIFEHLATMLYKFHLYTFENASGRDELLNGYLETGKPTSTLWGLPYPYFNNSGTPDNPGEESK
ncbi:MAG: mechanosensitive ion channel family protein [Prevotella sp.]|nr:mechanosensitive ion channel family protein [Bacteroides sp.]MCM1367188.1 mechanosensitive ion channel family protein [Prevotella sp.]